MKKSGFTLLELLVVIGLFCFFALGIWITNYYSNYRNSEKMKTIEKAGSETLGYANSSSNLEEDIFYLVVGEVEVEGVNYAFLQNFEAMPPHKTRVYTLEKGNVLQVGKLCTVKKEFDFPPREDGTCRVKKILIGISGSYQAATNGVSIF